MTQIANFIGSATMTNTKIGRSRAVAMDPLAVGSLSRWEQYARMRRGAPNWFPPGCTHPNPHKLTETMAQNANAWRALGVNL